MRTQSQMHDITESKNEAENKVLDRNPQLLRRRRSSTVMSTADVELIKEDMAKLERGHFKPKPKKPSKPIAKWDVNDVEKWIKDFGSAYEKYGTQFKSERMTGADLLKLTEELVAKKFRMAKIHRIRILLEISKLNGQDPFKEADGVPGFNWSESEVQKWADRSEPPVNLYAKHFYDNAVNGLLLFELDFEDLKDMRIPEIAQQKILMKIRETQAQFLGEPPDYDGLEEEEEKPLHNLRNGDSVANGQNGRSDGHLSVPATGHVIKVVKDMVNVLRDVVKLSSVEAETRMESTSDKCLRLSKTSGAQQQKILVQVVQEIAGVMRLVVGNKNKELKQKTDRIWQQSVSLTSSNLNGPVGIMNSDEEMAHMWDWISPQSDEKKDQDQDSELSNLWQKDSSNGSSNGSSSYSIPTLEMPQEKNLIKKASEGTRRRQSAHVLPTADELNAPENDISSNGSRVEKKNKELLGDIWSDTSEEIAKSHKRRATNPISSDELQEMTEVE